MARLSDKISNKLLLRQAARFEFPSDGHGLFVVDRNRAPENWCIQREIGEAGKPGYEKYILCWAENSKFTYRWVLDTPEALEGQNETDFDDFEQVIFLALSFADHDYIESVPSLFSVSHSLFQ